jgi:alkylation response protein AidB-like acyl-CoA dehydrogenase
MNTNSLIDRARALAPEVRASADETELNRTISNELAASIRDADLFAVLVPKEVGGQGADLVTALEVIEIISHADGSTGWSLMANASGASLVAAHVGDSAAEAIFGASDGRATVAGMLGPGGSCVAVDGGFRGSGSFHFGSGAAHADWIACGVLVIEDGKPRKLPSGAVELRALVVPRDAVKFDTDWNVIGLSGTGSYDYRLAETFVAADYSFVVTSLDYRRGGREFDLGVFGLAALGHAAVALGITGRALEEIATSAPGRKRLGYPDGIGNHPVFLHEFAHIEAMYQGARAYTYDVFRQAQHVIDTGGELSSVQRHRFRHALTYVHRVGEEVVEWCYRWAGTEALRRPHPLGRCLGDIHGATQHLFVDPLTYVDAAPAIVESWQVGD